MVTKWKDQVPVQDEAHNVQVFPMKLFFGCPSIIFVYPLVMTKIAMENDHRDTEFSPE